MDLDNVTGYRRARSRADLVLAAGERILAGGTWLFSEPQAAVRCLVDVTSMGWPGLEITEGGLRIGATCTLAELVSFEQRPGWNAQPLFFQCASALLASFKVWNVATVGGNICHSLSAAGMVSLCVALDGIAVVWTPGGGHYRLPIQELVTGNGENVLAQGEVLRAVDLPEHALQARTAYRKMALADLGRSSAVLTGRVDSDGSAVFSITAATLSPTVLRYPELPSPDRLRSDVQTMDGFHSDQLGVADWRRQVSAVLLEEALAELAQ